MILGEEPRRRFAWFVIPALLGVWLIAFPQPFDVHAQGIEPIALALGAAVLWGPRHRSSAAISRGACGSTTS